MSVLNSPKTLLPPSRPASRNSPMSKSSISTATPAEKKEPLWTAFEKDGWNALVQQPFRELTGIKTHFLTVEFRNGVYHLESRQHDGSTGLTSPAVRIRETRAEEQVARLAGQMLFPDFGAVGTIISGKEGDPTGFVMKIRGSARGGVEASSKPAMSSPFRS